MSRESILHKAHFLTLIAGNLKKEIAMLDKYGQDIFPPRSRADDLERRPNLVYRSVGDTGRMNAALDFAFTIEYERRLEEEKRALKQKYRQLKAAIEQEIQACREEEARLMNAIRYSVIAEDSILSGASAPTSTIQKK